MKQKIKSICILFITGTLFSSFSPAQTVVPAGLGPMSSTQPDRETAVLSGNLLRTGGQNPTVKIVWGDEDGEISGKSWDNTVVISTNQGVGSFSTTITIPNQEKIYYFRSVAENAGGTVVSRSLGVLNPSAPVGVADLRGRWSFDDSNFSSPVNPSDYTSLQLWLDAADLTTITHSSNSVSQWNDKSGNNRNISQTGATGLKPTLSGNSVNFNGSQYLFNNTPFMYNNGSIEIFVVASGNTQTDKRILFEGSSLSNNPFYAFQINNTAPQNKLAAYIRNTDRSVRREQDAILNDVAMDGTSKLLYWKDTGSSVSARVNGGAAGSLDYSRTGTMSSNQFCVGGVLRSSFDAGFAGNIKEIIILNPTTNSERQKIEGYLAHKWGIILAQNQTLAAKDSSGNNYHGVLRKTFSPAAQPELKLWLDASDSSTLTHSSNAVTQWRDKSGNDYHAGAPSNEAPTTGAASMNGKNVLTWADGKRMKSSTPANANWQDVYVVARWTGGSTFTNHNGIFGGSTGATGNEGAVMNSSTGNTMWSGWANNKHLNGTSVSLTAQVLPTMSSPFLFSFSKDTAVSATGYAIGDDRWYSREWVGHFAEVLAFGSKLPDATRQKIEGYLAHKWGLSGNLPSNHPYKLAHPLSTGSPAFITDTPFGDGKAIDLADGHVEISTGGNEDVFDGNGSFSVSAWVKGWPDEEKESIISKGYAIPKLESNPNMKLWLDAADTSSLLSRVKPE
jgi:hypothetical protein